MEFIINNVSDIFYSITDFLFKQTVYTLILFVIIFIAAFFLRRKSPQWHFGLWLLVLIRLILPTDLSLPISARSLAERIPLVNNVPVSMDGIVDKVAKTTYYDFEIASNNETIVQEDNAEFFKNSFNQKSDKFVSWPILFIIIWLTGCVLLALIFANRLFRFHDIIKHSSLIQDRKLEDFLISWHSRLKIRRKVSIISSDEFISPFTIGLFRPVIFIPQLLLKTADKETIHSIIAHEMVHIKRLDDLWIKVQNILRIIYFFNPAVWYANRKINLAREQICDSTVLAGGIISAKSYGNGILQVLKSNLFGFDLADSLPGFGSHKKIFKHRIENIKNGSAVKKLKTMFVFSAVSLIGIFMLPLAGGNYSVNAMDIDAKAIDTKVDKYIRTISKEIDFSGVILIAKDGKPIVERSYGMANIAEKIANTPQTKFRIDENNKQFTAVAVMKLQEQGKLNVRDSISKYIDNCPDAWKPITIHHLLTHTSGIPQTGHIYNMNLTEFIAYITRLFGLEFAPGTGFKYTNNGYFLLSQIIVKASGMSFRDFMHKTIFEPLGMKNTGVGDHRNVTSNYANGYNTENYMLGRIKSNDLITIEFNKTEASYSSGSMYSTVEDLLIWDQALYSEKLLSRKSLDAIFQPYSKGYGYGWGIDHFHNREIYVHDNYMLGFLSGITRFPEEKILIVILSNYNMGYIDYIEKINWDLMSIIFGEKYKIFRERKVARVDPVIYDKYVGEYEFSEIAPGFIITVTKENDGLFTQATGQPRFEVFPASSTVFFPKVLYSEIEFLISTGGRVTEFIVRQGGREWLGKRIK